MINPPIKQLLPDEWWRIAECVDAYEADCGAGFPDLRAFLGDLSGEMRRAALAELVKVDLERRQAQGEPRAYADYVVEYPELDDDANRTHMASGTLPSDEFSLPLQAMIGTKPFGAQPDQTRPFSRGGTSLEPSDRAPDVGATSALDNEPTPVAGAGSGATVIGRGAPADFDDDPSRAPRTLEVHSNGTARSGGSKPAAARTKASVGDGVVHGASTAPGDLVGRYRVEKTLGSGTFGVVYQCRDEELRRSVAVKMPRRARSGRDQQSKQFLHEAQSAARLRHPGIVTVLDKGKTDDGRAYIVYEFVDGVSLQARMQRGGYTPQEAAVWVAEIAEALQHAHQQGIVHRDIKPANVLLDERGRVKVADFGLAKMDDAFFTDDQGRVLGTVAYMSPEQAAGKSEWSSPQSDIYALGVVLYELLCRKLPFTKGSTDDILKQVIARPPAPPRTVDESIPKNLEAICLRAMAKDPAARYATAGDMAAELRAAIAPPQTPAKRGLIYGAAGAGALALALFAAFRPEDRTPSAAPVVTDEDQAKLAAQIAARVNAVVSDPAVKIHLQRGNESGTYRELASADLPLKEGDRVQVHVNLNAPKFLYLYWLDDHGFKERLWPKDVEAQTPKSQLTIPESADESVWQTMDAARGYDMVLVALSDEELSDSQLRNIESQVAFRPANELEFKDIAVVGSDVQQRVSRGLSGIAASPKRPLTAEFEKALDSGFDAYYGLAFPHQ